jgi:PAS domain S-box-containing protein
MSSTSHELENFFTLSLNLLCVADSAGTILTVNKSWETVFGYPASELDGKKLSQFIHPEDLPAIAQVFELLEKQKSVSGLQNRFKAKTGNYRLLEWRMVQEKGKIYAAASDTTEQRRAQELENELLKISPQLASIAYSQIDGAVNSALSRMGKFLDADRAYIFLLDQVNQTCSNTHEWCNTGIAPEKDNLQDVPKDLTPMWMATLERHENVIIPSVKDLPESWQGEREILEPQGIQSLLVMPMLRNNEVFGFIGIDSVVKRRDYKPEEINVLTVWGNMLTSLINKQKADFLLDQARQNYQRFFNTIDDFIFVLDFEGKIIAANEEVHTRLGYTPAELTGKHILFIHPPDRQNEVADRLGEFNSTQISTYSVPLLTKSGNFIPVETKIKIGYWDGKKARFCISKDITQIQLSEGKFSRAFQANAAMMTICDFEDGRFLDVNQAFTESLGYEWEELIGKTSAELLIFEEITLREEIVKGILDNKPVRKKEVQMRTKTGTFKTGLLSTDLIYVEQKKCLLTVIVDITERKRAEEEISVARHEAEKANKAKSEFLSRMSHELRTPMNSILGFAQLLEMGDLSASQKNGVSHILRSGKHLLNLINDVLDISRIEAGHLSVSLEPLNVPKVLEEVVESIHPQAKQKDITVHQAIAWEQECWALADHLMLRQVFLNLLDNAIKYNRKGGMVNIRVEAGSLIGNSRMIRISFADTGKGISAENLPKLFKPFERIGAEKTTIVGTGLGLSVVKKLIEAMEGQLGVESMEGKGSQFWVELPLSLPTVDGQNSYDRQGESNYMSKTNTATFLDS